MPTFDCATGKIRKETAEELAAIKAAQSNPPPLPASPEDRVLDALRAAGVIDDQQAGMARLALRPDAKASAPQGG